MSEIGAALARHEATTGSSCVCALRGARGKRSRSARPSLEHKREAAPAMLASFQRSRSRRGALPGARRVRSSKGDASAARSSWCSRAHLVFATERRRLCVPGDQARRHPSGARACSGTTAWGARSPSRWCSPAARFDVARARRVWPLGRRRSDRGRPRGLGAPWYRRRARAALGLLPARGDPRRTRTARACSRASARLSKRSSAATSSGCLPSHDGERRASRPSSRSGRPAWTDA